MKLIARVIAYTGIILVAFGVFPGYVHALSMSTKIELAGDPGRVATGEVVVYNDQETDSTFYFSTANFEAQGESGTPNFTDARDGLATWIQVPESVNLKADEQVRVPVVVTIPTDAHPGGYFAAIFLSSTPTKSDAGGEVSIGFKVGTLVLLRVAGNVDEKGGVLEFTPVTGSRVYDSLPIGFSYRFQNSGGDRVVPAGTVVMRSLLGWKSKTIDANPSRGNVLPFGSVRKFEVTWGPDQASHGFFAKAWSQARHFAFGRYGVTLGLRYGETGVASAKTSVWVIPWQLLLIVVVGGGAVFTGLRTLVRRYNRWVIDQARRAIEMDRAQADNRTQMTSL